MFKNGIKSIGFIVIFVLVLVGCSNDTNESNADKPESKEVELTLVNWESEMASSNVVGKVLEDLGYDVTITPVDMAIMWQSIVTGDADGMVAAWLPEDMEAQFAEYGEDVVDLGPNLDNAKIGLAVPTYMDVDSIEDLTDEAGKVITGIDPGSGVVAAAEAAKEEYDNLNDWDIQVSSDGVMVTALGQAYENEEAIIVTGWAPHWKFSRYDLKFLEDPKGAFGEEQYISTMVREGLEEDMPEVYKVLDQFYWTVEDMEEVMLEMSEGVDAADAAANWVEKNPEKVAEWTKDIN